MSCVQVTVFLYSTTSPTDIRTIHVVFFFPLHPPHPIQSCGTLLPSIYPSAQRRLFLGSARFLPCGAAPLLPIRRGRRSHRPLGRCPGEGVRGGRSRRRTGCRSRASTLASRNMLGPSPSANRAALRSCNGSSRPRRTRGPRPSCTGSTVWLHSVQRVLVAMASGCLTRNRRIKKMTRLREKLYTCTRAF